MQFQSLDCDSPGGGDHYPLAAGAKDSDGDLSALRISHFFFSNPFPFCGWNVSGGVVFEWLVFTLCDPYLVIKVIPFHPKVETWKVWVAEVLYS